MMMSAKFAAVQVPACKEGDVAKKGTPTYSLCSRYFGESVNMEYAIFIGLRCNSPSVRLTEHQSSLKEMGVLILV